MRERYLHLNGLSAPVRLLDTPEVEQQLPAVVSRWPFTLDAVPGATPFATLASTTAGYSLTSAYSPAPRVHADAVNAACDLVVEIIWQLLRDNPTLLCLHAAAVNAGSGLIVFPATRRAGKSLLTTALARRGARLFGDDFLPLQCIPGQPLTGIAGGVAPRLRLPLPEGLSRHLLDFLNAAGWSNRQYRYLPGIDIAPHGEAAPIGALVLLNRVDAGRATLERAGRGEMLRALLKQNFARSAGSDHILAAVYALAESTPAWQLTFRDVEEAAELVLERLATAGAPVPARFQPPPRSAAVAVPSHDVDPLRQFRQLPGADVRSLEGERFATSADLRTILHMDEGAGRIWTLLQDPTSLDEAVTVLSTAFPEVPPDRVAAETREAFRTLATAGLIGTAD